MDTFEAFRASVDDSKVTAMVEGFKQGRGTGEKDASDEAFVAMLLGVREEIVTGDFWWFRDQVKSGAECEIHYAMYVDEDVLERRRKIVRDFVETMEATKKQRRTIEDMLIGWLED